VAEHIYLFMSVEGEVAWFSGSVILICFDKANGLYNTAQKNITK